ncbi:HNH endonuclease [Streptomyces sp. NPDC055692]|uniref:HNH endonuclease n=1 Tax=Streptomyces sp. NPDC055692 TaxID=3155683 RepID=UPI0034393AD3
MGRPHGIVRVLWSKGVAGPNGCIIWTGSADRGGYGKTRFNGKHTTAHQAAYEAMVGPVPEGMELDHTCHTRDRSCNGGRTCQHRKCFNPHHLEPVTPKENTLRSENTGPGQNYRREVCANGHPFTEANTHIRPNGNRTCRECARLSVERRVQSPPQPPKAETCRRGHRFTPENTYQNGAVNTCRECRRASQADYRARKRARLTGVEVAR